MSFQLKDFISKPESMLVSASLFAYSNIEDFRNGSEGMSVIETIRRRVIGELGFGALFLVSIVEALFRTTIGLLVIPFACALPCFENFLTRVSLLCLGGALFSLETAAFSAISLAYNIWAKELSVEGLYQAMLPRQVDGWNQNLIRAIR
jgi:hypothetical protein